MGTTVVGVKTVSVHPDDIPQLTYPRLLNANVGESRSDRRRGHLIRRFTNPGKMHSPVQGHHSGGHGQRFFKIHGEKKSLVEEVVSVVWKGDHSVGKNPTLPAKIPVRPIEATKAARTGRKSAQVKKGDR